MGDKLTVKQQAFVDCYTGNGTEAARKAGYKGNDNTLCSVGKENLRKPHIKQAIEKRNAGAKKKTIATREARQEFWTGIMEDTLAEYKDRLAASKLLGMSEADFTQKIQHEVPEPIKMDVTVKTVRGKGKR